MMEDGKLFQSLLLLFYLLIGIRKTKSYKNQSQVHLVNLWNSLPADVISAPTVALFKKNLDDLRRTTRYGHSQRPAA